MRCFLSGAQQHSDLTLLTAPAPTLLFDAFLSSLLSSPYFLPVFLPTTLVHWLGDQFSDLDGCVWAAALRYMSPLVTHMSPPLPYPPFYLRCRCSLTRSLTTHISRVHALLIDHFLKHQGLLCMYNNISFVQEVFDFIYAC